MEENLNLLQSSILDKDDKTGQQNLFWPDRPSICKKNKVRQDKNYNPPYHFLLLLFCYVNIF